MVWFFYVCVYACVPLPITEENIKKKKKKKKNDEGQLQSKIN